VQNTFNLQNHRAFDKTLEAALNNISGKFVCPMLVACTVFWSLNTKNPDNIYYLMLDIKTKKSRENSKYE